MKIYLSLLAAFLFVETPLPAQTTPVVISETLLFGPSANINAGEPIPLMSFKINVKQASLTEFAGKLGSASKSQFAPMTIFKSLDQTTPQLFLACALGTPFKDALLTVSQTTGDQPPQVIFQILLNNVIIASMNDDSTMGDGTAPIESATLSYSKIGWQYTPTQGQPTSGAFDVLKNGHLPFNALSNPLTDNP